MSKDFVRMAKYPAFAAALLFFFSLFLCPSLAAQDTSFLSLDTFKFQESKPQTLTDISLDTISMEKIKGLRDVFTELNKGFSSRIALNEEVKKLLHIEEGIKPIKLSEEALFWIHYKRDPSTVIAPYLSYQDTVISDPLFLPILFRGELLPADFQLYDKNHLKAIVPQTKAYPLDTIFKDYDQLNKDEAMAYKYIQDNHPQYFKHTIFDLPLEQIETLQIEKPKPKDVAFEVKKDADFSDVEAPVKFIPERRYWTSSFESTAQFTETYISPNWYKGGTGNVNLFTRQYLKYDYNRNKVKFTNEAELKVSINNAPKDTIHSFSFPENVFRMHSNIGIRAFEKWYYTLDGEFTTNLFTTYNANSHVRKVALFSPATLNLGLGMKYDFSKTLKGRNRKFSVALNVAPLSYTYKFSTADDIIIYKDPSTGEKFNYQHLLGSTIRANTHHDLTSNIRWNSRVYYFTSYENVLLEFENTIDLAINRFFSTRIYLHLRYDDSVKKSYKDVAKTDLFDTYFQINQLLSFGFNYRW